jgi:hypothetical protein
MAIAHQIVALNASTPTLVSIPLANEVAYESKASISVQNLDSGITIYLGSSNVTSSSYGYKLLAGQSFSVDLLASDQLYAIAASGTPNVAIFAAEV